MKTHRILLALILASILCMLGCEPKDIEATYYRFTPMVVDQSSTTNVVLEVKVEGSPTDVKLRLESTGTEVPLVDDGSGSDATAGDGIYTVSIAMTDILYNFTTDDVYRNFIGYLRLYSGTTQVGQYNIFKDFINSTIPSVSVTSVSASVQYTEHLVNIVRPAFFSDFNTQTLLQDFYTHFGDDYDFANIIYEIPHFKNRHHFGTKNDVQNIGIAIFDNTALYGSGGRLMGCTVFPIPSMFDGASPNYNHELGHQWINFLTVSPLNVAVPHYPLSDLASGIMGWANAPGGQGLTFNYDLIPAGSNYTMVANTDPKVYKDLSLYLMGFIPSTGVGSHFVFDDQTQPITGTTLSGPVTTVTISDIISHMGARIPASTMAQKKFRMATIIVSKDGLLSVDAMRLYDYFSSRAEETSIVPFSSGFVKGNTKPFYLATQNIGRLDARIKRHILVDASRDGGVWWFPQIAPFDETASHQGKQLADFLKSLGHKVTELPRPYTITPELLADYDVVIRAVGLGSYTVAEIAAYQNYVQNGGNLLLLADHSANDGLAIGFGLHFQGATRGANMLTSYVAHPLTQSVGPLFYNVGSGLTSYPAGAQILGNLSAASYLDLNDNNTQDAGEPSAPSVLGVMTYGQGRIVFCGDTNMWLSVPQPLTNNFLLWVNDP
jgi:hypothetical protein